MPKRSEIKFLKKVDIVNQLKCNPKMSQKDIAKMFKVSKAIVTRIKSQMVEIEKQNESTNAGIILKRKRNEQVAGLSDLLYQWFEKARDKGLSRSDDILRDRAKEIAKCLSDSTFKASNGFLYK